MSISPGLSPLASSSHSSTEDLVSPPGFSPLSVGSDPPLTDSSLRTNLWDLHQPALQSSLFATKRGDFLAVCFAHILLRLLVLGDMKADDEVMRLLVLESPSDVLCYVCSDTSVNPLTFSHRWTTQ